MLASASATAAAAAAAAGAAVVGDNSYDGRCGNGDGSSGGGCVNSGGGSSVNGGSVDNDVSDDSSCGGGGDGCGGGAETVMIRVLEVFYSTLLLRVDTMLDIIDTRKAGVSWWNAVLPRQQLGTTAVGYLEG